MLHGELRSAKPQVEAWIGAAWIVELAISVIYLWRAVTLNLPPAVKDATE